MDKYRQDLDGIRALAVILVLLFHIDVTLFKAGFIGVDVFFTISGFLISGIVIKQANKGGFSFKNFYIRRATRLLPAYLFMLVIISFVCWYVLAPLAYYDFLKSALSSTLFISNIYFLINHSGYFSTSVHELPLLHTWSLAVEEQFYLVMPLLIIIWLKIKGFLFRISTLVAMLITTTIFSIYLTNINQGASYFLVISRIHEFFFGMILAVLINHYKERLTPPTLIANILSTLSFSGLIIISIFLSSKDNFPGYIAAVVCLLTMLLIYSGVNTKCLSHKVLGCKPMVWVGLLSYSLYLWHWPIVSLLKYTGTEFTVHVQLIIILASFFGACLSYFYVEKPFRYGRYSKSGFVALVLYMLPAVIIGLLVMNTDKLPSPYSQQLQKIEMMTKSEPEEGRESCHSNLFNKHDSCYLGEKSALKSRAMLWGDSHASHFAPFIDLLAKSQNKKVKDATMGNCPPLQNVADFLPNPRKACLAKNSKILQYIKEQKIEEVYLAGSWFGYYNEVSEMVGSQVAEQQLKAQIQVTVKTLKEYGVKEINFFATVARPSNDLSSCYFKQLAFARGECTFRLSSEQQKLSVKLKSMFTEFGDVRFINVNSLFCKNNICATVIDKIPLYRDGNHLNRYGAQQLATKYMEF